MQRMIRDIQAVPPDWRSLTLQNRSLLRYR